MNNSKFVGTWRVGTRRVVYLLATLILCFLVQAVVAQNEVTYDQVNDVAKDMFCPVCESEPLDTCATQACQDWREEIAAQLAEGRTKTEIHENFRARYGDRVLANPPAEGLNLILWFGIPVALIVGGFFFSRYLRRLRSSPTATTPHPPPAARHAPDLDPYLKQIEEEVRQR